MPKRAEPVARIRVPVDPPTALRLRELGQTVEGTPSTAVLVVHCDPSVWLAQLAADRCEPAFDEKANELVLDLVNTARRVIDHTPPIANDVTAVPFPLWPEPVREAYVPEPLHLAADVFACDRLEARLQEWIASLPKGDVATLRDIRAEWQAQADRMLSEATERAEAVAKQVDGPEREKLVVQLKRLAELVRHGNLDPENALDYDEDGQPYLRSDHVLINEAYYSVLTRCDQLGTQEGDRDRSAAVLGELDRLARAMSEAFPERLRLAHQSGLLHESVGVARDELLPLAWPGWRYLEDGERFKKVINPTQRALEALIEMRGYAKGVWWYKGSVNLMWLSGAERPVLVAEFLGRTIVKEVGE